MTRIYTEDTNRKGIIEILDSQFTGYTVIPTWGRWKGKDEASLVIELLDAPLDAAKDAAKRIKEMNNQESVLVTEETVNAAFI